MAVSLIALKGILLHTIILFSIDEQSEETSKESSRSGRKRCAGTSQARQLFNNNQLFSADSS